MNMKKMLSLALAGVMALGLAALLPALFLYRRELVLELQKRLHR